MHDGVNFMRAACVIAVEKAKSSFEPMLEVRYTHTHTHTHKHAESDVFVVHSNGFTSCVMHSYLCPQCLMMPDRDALLIDLSLAMN